MDKRPAHVRYIGGSNSSTPGFIKGNVYEAFFIEYWEGKRNSLHVRDESGDIKDFVHLEEFEIMDDVAGLLEMHEAVLRCNTHEYDDEFLEIQYGKEYVAIGADKDGNFLVNDETGCCFFYSPEDFDIVSDPDGILSRESVYYSFE